MITKLTAAQEAKFPFYVEKWIKIGLSTERIDKPRSEIAIRNLYKLAHLKRPKIIYCPCPISGCLSALLIPAFTNSKSVDSVVDSAVDFAVGSAVRSAVGSVVGSAVDSVVGSAVDFAVGLAVGSAVGSAVDSAVGSAVDFAVGLAKIKLENSNGTSYLGGSLWPAYSAWADFFNIECGISIDRNYLEMVESCGYYFCLKDFAILTDRPAKINLKNGRLHNEKGMSIEYSSGWGLWHLNGIQMDREQVLINSEKMTAEMVLKEENVDRRRELLRKFGIDRMVDHGKVKHEANGYKLIDMAPLFKNLEYAPYLFMENASLPGTFHLEGVHPECQTVEHAINWRKHQDIDKEWKPEKIT